MNYGIINYEVIGDGTPVLIIHGWGISKLTMKGAFEPIFKEVPGYRRYYIDLPGMGASEHGNVRNSDDILEILHDFAYHFRELINKSPCKETAIGLPYDHKWFLYYIDSKSMQKLQNIIRIFNISMF